MYRYVRVKRHNQTFFIPCSADGKISTIKENIAIALNVSEKDDGVTADQMRLLLPSSKSQPTVLEDNQTLTHYDITNDTVMHVVFQISENTWETVAVESMEIASASAPS
jgi:Ubiquitin family